MPPAPSRKSAPRKTPRGAAPNAAALLLEAIPDLRNLSPTFAAAVAREAGAIVLRWYGDGVHVEWKGRGDPVTEADKDANAHIVAALGREFPDDAVLAEESADDRSRL